MDSYNESEAAEFLLNVAMGFWLGPSLWVAVQLKLADHLAEAPVGAAELARKLEVDPGHLRRLIIHPVWGTLSTFPRAGRITWPGPRCLTLSAPAAALSISTMA